MANRKFDNQKIQLDTAEFSTVEATVGICEEDGKMSIKLRIPGSWKVAWVSSGSEKPTVVVLDRS